MRFSAALSGWFFDETMQLTLHRPSKGYHGEARIERPGLIFAAGERLSIGIVQADWQGVLWDDWRAMHAAVWSLSLCGGASRPPLEDTTYCLVMPLSQFAIRSPTRCVHTCMSPMQRAVGRGACAACGVALANPQLCVCVRVYRLASLPASSMIPYFYLWCVRIRYEC